MNKEFIKSKIFCAVNQAKVRNLTIDTRGWHTTRRNGKYVLDNDRYVYIFFID